MMKNINLIILFILSLALAACHKDKELETTNPVVSEVTQTVSTTQATFSWQVDFPGKYQTAVEISEKESMADLKQVEGTKNEDKYTAVIKDLTAGTKYYYRIVVWNKFNRFEKEVEPFTTLEDPEPPGPSQDTTYYTISVSCQPEEGGTVSGGGTFAEGDTCTLTAMANVGYTFVNWTEDGSQVSTDLEYVFEVTSNRSLVANFSSEDYIISVEIDPENGGTITGAGGYNYGDECTLTATPNEGYDFVNWTKDGEEVSTNSTYTFTVTETAEYVVHFQIQSYTITVAANPENGGTVEGGGTFEYGQTCTVKATEANGYHFVNWTENDEQVSSNAEYTITVRGDHDLVANFTAEDYIISVEIEPENGGTVTGAGGYNYGDECTLTATPNEGYDFTKWTQNGTQVSTEQSISFTVTESASYKAHFTAKSYTISVSAEPSEGGNVTGGGDYHYGDDCTLTATANEGYDFDHWTKNGSQINGGATINFAVTENATYIAYFNAKSYTITTQCSPTNGGTVSGGGNYNYGATCTLTATASSSYEFDHWTKNGSQIDGEASINFTVTENATYVAYFTKQLPTGALNGRFTINANGDQVCFSQGNLQYQASTNTWQFAANQYDRLRYENTNISQTNNGWIDLFGWGTSGWNNGNLYYHPWNAQNDGTSAEVGYGYGPTDGSNYTYDLTGIYANADWGIYNEISNGGDEAGLWRTLTGGVNGEWNYIINRRMTASGIRYAKAIVNGVNGLVILPDNWNANTYTLYYTNTPDALYNSNSITASQWTALENAGAVFLPATGWREGAVFQNYEYGVYWSTSHHSYGYAYKLSFTGIMEGSVSTSVNCDNWGWRKSGYSVRLVCPAQ